MKTEVIITNSMLTGLSNRVAYLLKLEEYLDSREWKNRRDKYLEDVKMVSDVSGLHADEVHHITYPFKSVEDFDDRSLYGSEKDFQLLALTSSEHRVVHSDLQSVAHKSRRLLAELRRYYGFKD